MIKYGEVSRCVNLHCNLSTEGGGGWGVNLSTEGAGVLTYNALSPLRDRCVNVQCNLPIEGQVC